MRVRLKSQMFFIITPLMAELLKRTKIFEFMICNHINLHLLHLCVKSELEEQRSHKVVTVILLLVSLQCFYFLSSLKHCLILTKSCIVSLAYIWNYTWIQSITCYKKNNILFIIAVQTMHSINGGFLEIMSTVSVRLNHV